MTTKPVRCAIYTRVSTDYGLEQDFNSLDAQHDAAQAYIRSQAHAGWMLIRSRYADGGYSGGSIVRPALQRLLADVRARKVDVVVVYKVDRLTRSLADFAKLVELFDGHAVSFVSVTQQFNTTTSMGRLTLNVLLSFAQFEREVTSERIRDKIAASKRKGLWVGGIVPLGYATKDRKNHSVARDKSKSLLIGRIYDDRGNRMSPSHVRKGGIKYRYYLSSPLLHGRPERAGTVRRVPAAEVEALVGSAVRVHLEDSTQSADRDLIRDHVVRVEIKADQLVVELKAARSSGPPSAVDNERSVVRISWKKTPMKRRREIIVSASA